MLPADPTSSLPNEKLRASSKKVKGSSSAVRPSQQVQTGEDPRGLTSELLSARQAASRLGVKLSTLYAYVSRGQLTSMPGLRGPARVYRRSEVERLRARTSMRRVESQAGEPVLRANEPLLESSITWLEGGEPIYRGQPAVELARNEVSFERVAELLWTGDLPDGRTRWPGRTPASLQRAWRGSVPLDASPIGRLSAALPLIGLRDQGRHGCGSRELRQRARAIMIQSCSALARDWQAATLRRIDEQPSVAGRIALALGARPTPRNLRALNRVLVSLADFALMPSTLAVRIAAAMRADLYSCLCAGLAVLSGPRHGLGSERVWALIAEIRIPERTTQVVETRLRHGVEIPGFQRVSGFDSMGGLESSGLVSLLLETARELAPRSRTVRISDALIARMAEPTPTHPNLDLALVCIAGALRLDPARTPALLALGRIAGWTAHAMEQYAMEPAAVVRPPYRSGGG